MITTQGYVGIGLMLGGAILFLIAVGAIVRNW